MTSGNSESRPARQTISYLTRRFRQVGLQPNARHGQNFLVDLNLLQILADAAEVTPDDLVLEVGTGMGSLTALLAERAAKVITVEVDEHLHQLAREELERFDNVVMLHQDALRNKNQIHSRVREAVAAALAEDPQRRFKVAANLPYNIATPLISNLLQTDPVPASMTVTIQKELADRILSGPGTKDYGSLSVWVQSLCDVQLVRVLPNSVFWPKPKVNSAIIHIAHRPEKRAQIRDVEFWHQFNRAMFFHRRKFIRAVAVSAFRNELDKAAVDQVLLRCQIGAEVRTEQLPVSRLIELCHAFQDVAPTWRLHT